MGVIGGTTNITIGCIGIRFQSRLPWYRTCKKSAYDSNLGSLSFALLLVIVSKVSTFCCRVIVVCSLKDSHNPHTYVQEARMTSSNSFVNAACVTLLKGSNILMFVTYTQQSEHC
eukprot:745663-Hanusia_phi.AAC.1